MKNYSERDDQDFILNFFEKDCPIKNGYFIDIGANDGIKVSNTYALALLGWSGLEVEPDPNTYIELHKNCLAINGASLGFDPPRHFLAPIWSAICKIDGDVAFMSDGDFCSGLSKIGRVEDTTRKWSYIRVPSMNVNELRKYCTRPVDFLSIDAEGSDPDIIESIDFSWLRPKLIWAEIDKGEGTAYTRIFLHLVRNGYKQVFKNIGNGGFALC